MSTINIASFQPQISWPHGGTSATLRIQYSADFQDSFGQQVLRGMPQDVACVVSGTTLTVPSFNLISTNDAQVNALVTCSARFFDQSEAARDWLFQNFVVPQALAPACTIGDLRNYNQGAALVLPPDFYLSRDEIVALISSMLAAIGVAPATDLAQGLVRLSVAAADPADPEVWGTNDPLVRDALKWMGVELDPTMASPAVGNAPVFNASGKWEPGVPTMVPAPHAASHESGGSDEINVTDLVGLLATPQIPVPHAILHENGGLDEISIAGLSGLAADPQTPLAHKASHENGGGDEISVAGLSGLLADGQTPLAHNTSHQSGGSDPIKLDDLAAPDDNTDLDASAAAHGLMPKLSGNAGEFFNGAGGFSVPSGSGDVAGPAASVDSEIALFDGLTGKLIKRATGSGFVKAASGVYSAAAQVDLASEVTGDLPLANVAQASAASRLLGRGSAAGAGDFEEVSLGSGLTMTGTTLSSSGGIGGSTGATDNAILRADGAGGATLQNSPVTMADTDGTMTFPANTGDKIVWFPSNFGTGIEASTLTHWSQATHRFRIGGTTVSGGTSIVEITSSGLNIIGSTPVVAFGAATGDKIQLFGNSYGFGIEANNLTAWSNVNFRWRTGGTSVSTGTEIMTLSSAGLLAVSGGLKNKRVVTAKTTDYSVVEADSNTFFTNTGAGAGVIFTLPTPVVGMTFEFYRDANQTVTIDIGGAVTIQVGASVTTAGGNVTLDAVGSRIRVVAISTTQWVGDLTGTATFN